MPHERFGLSGEQWDFLAVFDAIGEPVSLDVVGAVSPLPPSRLIEVLKLAQAHALLETVDNDLYRLAEPLPVGVRQAFSRINTERRVTDLLNRLTHLNLMETLSPEGHLNLLSRSGREQGGELAIDLAWQFLENHQPEKALLFFEKGLDGLASRLDQAKRAALFIRAALTFSDLAFSLGREFVKAYRFLETAGPVAKQIGDLRTKTLIDLHVGRFFYLGSRRMEAVTLMKKAEAVIKDLGDEDIRTRAAEFLALYHYMQGRFAEAMGYFETGFRSFETHQGSYVANPSAPIFYGYCAAYLGQFHKAIGNLDSAWRRAIQEQNQAYAATLRASLGMILLLTKKEKEATYHLESALAEAKAYGNMLGRYFAQGYMAYLKYLGGDYEKASALLKDVAEEAKASNIVYQMSSPWLLEMIFDLRKQGHSVFTEPEFMGVATRLMQDPSLHIRGVLLRLLAQLADGAADSGIDTLIEMVKREMKGIDFSAGDAPNLLLAQSESLLRPTGDLVQLAKTRIELARLALKSGQREEAANLARKARQGLSGLWEDYFPDGIRALLDEQAPSLHDGIRPIIGSEQLLQAMTELAPTLDMNEFFHRMVATMNRLLRAEKGGLFWKEAHRPGSVTLRAARNLNASDITGPGFSRNLAAIRQCLQSGQPKILCSGRRARKLKGYHVYSLVCIPLKQHDQTRGVLYYDNSYLDGCFDFLDVSVLEKIAGLLNVYIERIHKIEALITDAKAAPLEIAAPGEGSPHHPLLARSPAMAAILDTIEPIAASDTPVLIQGETGVGKELMAKRIHRLSPRRNQPFIIIDPTTIPDNLVESELFGYEKGAFTGADRQKRGRIELAHQGTLFIDEIGEMPKPIQAKLLRVLQEKSFVRIGGGQPIHSDFRLLAATNRKLAAEVARGHFREDLFYRISTVPIHVPPLRERKEDIALLARHFLTLYTKKYNRLQLSLSAKDEEALTHYHWPGNVRELINVIERAVILSREDRLELNLEPASGADASSPFSDTPTMDALQRRYIEYILRRTNGKVSGKGGAAKILDMKRSTLYSRMEKLGLKRPVTAGGRDWDRDEMR